MTGWDTSACQGLLEDAAVALLTRQPIPARVLAHADLCPACRDEIAAMSQLPAKLALAADRQLVAPAQPSPALLPRLLAEVDRRRTRRRWTTLGVAAAAAAVAVGTTVGLHLAGPGSRTSADPGPTASATGSPSPLVSPGPSTPSGPSGGPTSSVAVSSPGSSDVVVASGQGLDKVTGASAEVAVLAGDWGSRVRVEVYDVPARTECRMVVVDRHGKRVEAGSWVVPAGGYRVGQAFTETVATRPAEVAMIEIVDNRTQRLMMRMKLRHV